MMRFVSKTQGCVAKAHTMMEKVQLRRCVRYFFRVVQLFPPATHSIALACALHTICVRTSNNPGRLWVRLLSHLRVNGLRDVVVGPPIRRLLCMQQHQVGGRSWQTTTSQWLAVRMKRCTLSRAEGSHQWPRHQNSSASFKCKCKCASVPGEAPGCRDGFMLYPPANVNWSIKCALCSSRARRSDSLVHSRGSSTRWHLLVFGIGIHRCGGKAGKGVGFGARIINMDGSSVKRHGAWRKGNQQRDAHGRRNVRPSCRCRRR